MDYFDVVGDAHALTAMAGLDPLEPHCLSRICIGLTGEPPLLVGCAGFHGKTVLIDGRLRVVASSSLAPARLRWVVAHELAHVYYARIGREEGALEERCDLVGAILCAPERVVRQAVSQCGENPIAVASYVGTTQSIALLRLGELGIVAGAVLVTSRRLLVRGDVVWPTRQALRQAVKTGARGATVVRLTDEPKRAGLIVKQGWD